MHIEISYGGKSEKTEILKKTRDPAWYQQISLVVNVPQPFEYAPPIRCRIYDCNRVTSDDLIGHFKINMTDVSKMMKKKQARWYSNEMTDLVGNKYQGEVYLACELIDPNSRAVTIFEIDRRIKKYTLHMLTIGLRGFKSPRNVKSQQIEYVGQHDQIVRANMNASNTCFVNELMLDLPYDSQLIPSFGVQVRDVMFGGIIKSRAAGSTINISKYIRKIDNNNQSNSINSSNSWELNNETNSVDVINAKEINKINNEISAEQMVEQRIFMAQVRCKNLAIMKARQLCEARITDAFDDAAIEFVENIERRELSIESNHEIDLRIRAQKAQESRKRELAMMDPIGDESKDEMDDENRVIEIINGNFALSTNGSGSGSYSGNETVYKPRYLIGRESLDCELENEIDCQAFESIALFNDIKRNNGAIKGLWTLVEAEMESPFADSLTFFMSPRMINIRLMILDAYSLVLPPQYAQHPLNKFYIIVKLGNQKKTSQMSDVFDESGGGSGIGSGSGHGNGRFYEMIEFNSKLPGVSDLLIEIWMKLNGSDNDVLIGSSMIDIEDRWFARNWRRLPFKPLEVRNILNPRSAAVFGKLRLWLDMFTMDDLTSMQLSSRVGNGSPLKKFHYYRCLYYNSGNYV